MIRGKRIAVAAPILNEEFFIDGWLESVTRFADEVVIIDGGSTDETDRKILSATIDHPEISWVWLTRCQTGEPYSNDWNEGKVTKYRLASSEPRDVLIRVRGEVKKVKSVKESP